MSFSLYLFGQWRLIRSDETGSQEIPLTLRKEQAILAYVAAQPQLAHSREVLMGLFWPDSPQENVANNLRVALHRLRRALDEHPDEPEPLLHIQRRQIRFNHSAHWCDVACFDKLTRTTQRHGHPASPLCPECAEALETALSLYSGPFLDGFFLPETPAFDEWLFATREHYRLQALDLLHHLTAYHLAQGNLTQAGHFAQRQIQIEPLAEQAYGQWMVIQAAGGDRAGALRTFERCRQVLHTELGVDPNEESRHIYRAILRGGPLPGIGKSAPSPPASIPPASPAPLPAPLPAPRLPAETTPLIGRANEIELLGQRIRAGNYRLFTIAGPGGIGKSRLALAVARQLQGGFPDGICFVPLAALNEAAQIPQAILSALGITIRSQNSSAEEQLLAALRSRHLLLLLDNFEHLLGGVELLLAILQEAPGVSLLVTSRVALQTQAEDILTLRGLALPAEGEGDVEGFPAVALFAERAYRLDKSFHISDANRGDVIALCRLLEGIPLGIELAASWLDSHSPAEIRAALAHDLDFLSAELRELPVRQRSLRALFDYSWQLLSREEQAALARLAFFRGGFDQAAAAAVAGTSPAILSSLQRHFLLRANADGRYDMHELLRLFAAQKLTLSPQAEARVAEQHSHWYLSLIAKQQQDLVGPHAGQVSSRLYREMDNFRLAWQTALEKGRRERLQEALPGLNTFYKMRGMYEEIVNLCAAAIESLDARAKEDDKMAWRGLRVRLGVAQADALEYRGMHSQALVMAERLIEEAHTAGDHWATVYAALVRGRCETESEDMEHAIERMKSFLPLLLPEEEPALVAEFYTFLGISYTFINRHAEAAAAYAAVESALDKKENHLRRGQLALYRGMDALLRGAPWQAEPFLQETLGIAEQIDSSFLRMRGLNCLGFLEAQRGNYEAAVSYHRAGLAVARAIGDPLIENHSLHNLCTNYLYLGNLAEARRMGEAGLEVAERNRLKSGIAYAQLHLGHVLLALEEIPAGRQMLHLARDRVQELGRAALCAEATGGIAWACYIQGDIPEALAAAQSALETLTHTTLTGCDEPARLLWHLYAIFRQTAHPQAATALSLGRQWIDSLADNLPEGPARQTFLTSNPYIRSLHAATTNRPFAPDPIQ